MATVGFGDVYVTSEVEVWFSIVAMLFGATVFGFVIGTVGVFFSSLTETSMRHSARMNDLITYMQHHKVPADLYAKTCTQYDYYLKRKSAYDEDVILGQLTDSLRQEVRNGTAGFSVYRSSCLRLCVCCVSEMCPCTLL